MKAARNLLIVIAAVAFSCMLAWLADSSGRQLWGLPLLLSLALTSYLIQWLAFVPAYLAQTEQYYDLTGSLTYAVVVLIAVAAVETHARALLLALLIGFWCTRLGSFLFRRVRRDGKDGRFDDIKPDWPAFLLAWTLQGLWVFVTLLAALIAITDSQPVVLDLWAAIGAIFWSIGFSIEVIADAQKSAFKSDPAHQNQFIRTGLWAWSRHPNYFGEILLWIGICTIALPSFDGWQWLGLLSPLFVAWLICFVSGVPLLEKRADDKWGGRTEYEKYKAATSVLIPRPPH